VGLSIEIGGRCQELGVAPRLQPPAGVPGDRGWSPRVSTINRSTINRDMAIPDDPGSRDDWAALDRPLPRGFDASIPAVARGRGAAGVEPAPLGEHPYAALVRTLLNRDETSAARALLAAALTVVGPSRELLDLSRVLAKPQAARVRRNDLDRTREYRWIREHTDAYRGQWVAVLGDRLVACAPSFRELRATIAADSFQDPPLVERID
jgi:hypothetical protein